MQNRIWKIGNHKSTVVSETKIQNTVFPCPPNNRESSDDEIEYYGGYLVCESIANNQDAKLIASAPELLSCLNEAIAILREKGIEVPLKFISISSQLTPL